MRVRKVGEEELEFGGGRNQRGDLEGCDLVENIGGGEGVAAEAIPVDAEAVEVWERGDDIGDGLEVLEAVAGEVKLQDVYL